MDIGSAVGGREGVRAEQIHALADYATSPCFDDRERLVLELADAMTATPAEVPDAMFARLRATFSEAQLVELIANIAWENYRARFNRTFGVGPEGFSEGAACAIPVRPRVAG
jgi:alkylhydroperoxidase family enzyme